MVVRARRLRTYRARLRNPWGSSGPEVTDRHVRGRNLWSGFGPQVTDLPQPATFGSVTNGVVSAQRLRTADQLTEVMSMRVPYGTWRAHRIDNKRGTKNSHKRLSATGARDPCLVQEPTSQHRTHSLPQSRSSCVKASWFVSGTARDARPGPVRVAPVPVAPGTCSASSVTARFARVRRCPM